MFESIQDGLSAALKTLRGKGKLTESNMREGLALIERSLLEADVNIDVVRKFMAGVTEQAIGERVLNSLDPTEHLVGIVHQELTNLMGPVDHSLHLKGDLTVLMLCGLQGSGKTTTCGKLASLLKDRGRKPLLTAADLQRPAAIDQLHVIGEQIGVPVYSERGSKDPVKVCQNSLKEAKNVGADVVILDTAGRLHIDNELMTELSNIDRLINPQQVYMVVDAMTGQDAVNSAKVFNEALELNGVIMTKLDGDARGGAALSVKAVTGVPIKFIGTGEHLGDLEEFHPDRMAGRILGLGDMAGLLDIAHRKLDAEEAAKAEEKLIKGEFTLDDFRKQLQQITKLGPMQKIMSLMPGMGAMRDMQKQLEGTDPEKDMKRMFGVIDSMTPDEKRNPKKVVDQSRRRRIAAGAGVEPHEVNELVKQYDDMATIMKEMAGMGMRDRMKKVQELQQSGALGSNGHISKSSKGTGKRLNAKEKAKLRKQRSKELRRKKREQKKNV